MFPFGARLREGLLPGISNIVQASTDLIDWQTILTNAANGAPLPVTDSAASSLTRRYYRVVVPTQ